MQSQSLGPWLVNWRHDDARTSVRLVCFPYAGAGPTVYRTWRDHLPDSVAVYAVHLPGRSSRLGEEPLTSIGGMAQAVAPQIRDLLEPPLVFFGHSMGALLGYEVAKLFHLAGYSEPRLLIASGRTAPHLLSREPETYRLPREALVETLVKVGGTPAQVVADQDLLELVLPMVRADLRAIDTYCHEAGEPLNCPVLALGGLGDDAVNEDELRGWSRHTVGGFALRMLPGGHFFLKEDERRVTAEVSAALTRLEVMS